VNRLEGRYGVCRSTDVLMVSSAGPHFGEEPPLVGKHGSGTIFLSSCCLKCQFCQNFDISQEPEGKPTSPTELAEVMLWLEQRGCHNINFVTPTHFAPQIVEALTIAVRGGFNLPLVYNCAGYESLETLKHLDGIVDIYMPDVKYAVDAHARKYSGVRDYWDTVRAALREMHRQVGDLQLEGDGLARSGLLIRHLVLPRNVAGSKEVLEFIAAEISQDSYVNIMDQYHPAYHASRFPELNRRISAEEYEKAITLALRCGLHRGFSIGAGNLRERVFF
jgi:putative pyruvate formate lyase activating enzyme